MLHVIPSVALHHGGPSRAIAAIERALAPVANVETLTTDDDGPGGRVADAVPPVSHRTYLPKWCDTYKFAPGAIPWLWRNVGRFDVVHIHALFSFTSTAAAMIAHRRGVPYVVRPLGTLAQYGITQRRPLLKRLSICVVEGRIIRRAAAMHFTSDSEMAEAARLGFPFRGVVIPLGVEDTAGERAWPATAGSRAVPAHNLLFLSRIDTKKNLPVLLDAFALLAREFPHLCLSIAGDGPPDVVDSLRRRAHDLDIDRRVRWLGHIEGPAKSVALADAGIFVLPSASENFGIAAVEAMLAGLPCILSPDVAIAEKAAADDAALIAPADPVQLSAALRSLLLSPERREQMGARAQAHARAHYSLTAMADRLDSLYRSIVAGQPRTQA